MKGEIIFVPRLLQKIPLIQWEQEKLFFSNGFFVECNDIMGRMLGHGRGMARVGNAVGQFAGAFRVHGLALSTPTWPAA